jgi:hypothetical protein
MFNMGERRTNKGFLDSLEFEYKHKHDTSNPTKICRVFLRKVGSRSGRKEILNLSRNSQFPLPVHSALVLDRILSHINSSRLHVYYYYYYYYYYYSDIGLVWAGIRAQLGGRYGSGTLHPGQILRGSLPLISPLMIIHKHFDPHFKFCALSQFLRTLLPKLVLFSSVCREK